MNNESKHEKISFRVTIGEKNQLKRMADLAGKPLAEYIREVSFSTPLNNTDKKMLEDLRQIKEKVFQQQDDIKYLKKSIYVITKLLLPVASEQLILRSLVPLSSEEKISQEKKSQEKIMAFLKECINEAEKKFNRE